MEQIRHTRHSSVIASERIASPTPNAQAPISRWIPPALIVSAVGYTTWILSYALDVNVGTVSGYVSELPAADQPYRWLFGGGDVLSGALAAAVAVAMLVRGRKSPAASGARPRLAAAAWIALAVFGVFTIADVAFPLDCAPSVDEACHAADVAGTISIAARIHVYTSVLTNAGILIHMGLVVWIVRGTPRAWPVLARFAAPVTLVAVVSTVVVLALIPLGNAVGIPQRVSVLCISAWLALLAWDVKRRDPNDSRERTP